MKNRGFVLTETIVVVASLAMMAVAMWIMSSSDIMRKLDIAYLGYALMFLAAAGFVFRMRRLNKESRIDAGESKPRGFEVLTKKDVK